MQKNIEEQLLSAEARALATNGPHGVNVVPVSVIEVVGGTIRLYDFFMGKTVENLKVDPEVALSAWKGFVGVQVKATAEYFTEGDIFSAALPIMKAKFPERTLRGVIVLTPTNYFDISASSDRAGKLLM